MSFKSSRTLFPNIFSYGDARSLKNMKYSQKQSHICSNTKNMFRSSCTNFLFRSSRTLFLVSFRGSRTFLKKYDILSEVAIHFLKHKKYISEAAAQIFTNVAQNIHTLREDFHNLPMVMKTSLMDG